jgi:hypothetical protein
MSQEMFEILKSIIIPILATLIGTVLGGTITYSIQKSNDKNKYLKLRYDSLYNPFYYLRSKIHKSRAWAISCMKQNEREEIINLLIKNISYADNYLKELIQELSFNYNSCTNNDFTKIDKIYNSIDYKIGVDRDYLENKIFKNNSIRNSINNKKICKNFLKNKEGGVFYIENLKKQK